MKINKLILESAYNNRLMSFDNDGNNNTFSKSDIPSSKEITNKYLYDFLHCLVGDKVFYDTTLLYNLLEGELVGYCVINDDNNPYFAYQCVCHELCTWDRAMEIPKKFLSKLKNKVDKGNFYLPSILILKQAYPALVDLGYDLDPEWYYWSSDMSSDGDIFVISNGWVTTLAEDLSLNCIVFFTIPDDNLNESTNLMSFEEDDNTFKKSKKIDNVFVSCYNFFKCQPGDEIYYSHKLGYNLIEGELVGYCVAPTSGFDSPIFAYKLAFGPTFIDTALKACSNFMQDKEFAKFNNFYLPNIYVLERALKYDTIYSIIPDIDIFGYIWSSSMNINKENTYKSISILSYLNYKVKDARITSSLIFIPFFKIPKDYISIKESTNLISFDNDLPNFEKSTNINSEQINYKYLYDFDNCAKGDVIYYDDTLGVNLIDGEILGYCVDERNEISRFGPFFIYREIAATNTTWNKATNTICNKLSKKYNIIFYLPEVELLKQALSENVGNIQIPSDEWFWSGTYFGKPSNSVCNNVMVNSDGQTIMRRSIVQHINVLPFFIPNSNIK